MSFFDVLIVAVTAILCKEILILILSATKIEEYTQLRIAGGLAYLILYIVCYPIRAWDTYSRSRGYYEKHGITRFQYIVLFRRVSNRVTNKKNGIKNDENCDD